MNWLRRPDSYARPETRPAGHKPTPINDPPTSSIKRLLFSTLSDIRDGLEIQLREDAMGELRCLAVYLNAALKLIEHTTMDNVILFDGRTFYKVTAGPTVGVVHIPNIGGELLLILVSDTWDYATFMASGYITDRFMPSLILECRDTNPFYQNCDPDCDGSLQNSVESSLRQYNRLSFLVGYVAFLSAIVGVSILGQYGDLIWLPRIAVAVALVGSTITVNETIVVVPVISSLISTLRCDDTWAMVNVPVLPRGVVVTGMRVSLSALTILPKEVLMYPQLIVYSASLIYLVGNLGAFHLYKCGVKCQPDVDARVLALGRRMGIIGALILIYNTCIEAYQVVVWPRDGVTHRMAANSRLSRLASSIQEMLFAAWVTASSLPIIAVVICMQLLRLIEPLYDTATITVNSADSLHFLVCTVSGPPSQTNSSGWCHWGKGIRIRTKYALLAVTKGEALRIDKLAVRRANLTFEQDDRAFGDYAMDLPRFGLVFTWFVLCHGVGDIRLWKRLVSDDKMGCMSEGAARVLARPNGVTLMYKLVGPTPTAQVG